MRKLLLVSVALAGLADSPLALSTFAAADDAPAVPDSARIQRMMDDQAVLLDAHLAGMKAGLKLTADQEKNWPAFEAAVREAARARADSRRQMHEHMGDGERPSPIEHMTMMSEHLQKMSAELKLVVDASKPLYNSLEDSQKRLFGPLLRDFMSRGPHGGDHGRNEGEGD
jgi:LTXXQ motif family protein